MLLSLRNFKLIDRCCCAPSCPSGIVVRCTVPAQLQSWAHASDLNRQPWQQRQSSRERSRIQISPSPPAQQAGSTEPMIVVFDKVDTFRLWLWFDLHGVPSAEQRELLEAVLSSWFTVGRLGGFNAQNLQVHYHGGQGASKLPYDSTQCDSSMEAMFHDIGPLEARGALCRCWVNMGTADELALDVLINALNTFSQENMGIKKLTIGGDSSVWPIPKNAKIPQDPLLTGMDTGDY